MKLEPGYTPVLRDIIVDAVKARSLAAWVSCDRIRVIGSRCLGVVGLRVWRCGFAGAAQHLLKHVLSGAMRR